MKVSSRLETRKNITNPQETQRLMQESRRKLLLAARALLMHSSPQRATRKVAHSCLEVFLLIQKNTVRRDDKITKKCPYDKKSDQKGRRDNWFTLGSGEAVIEVME